VQLDGASKSEQLPSSDELQKRGYSIIGYVYPEARPETVTLWGFGSRALDDNLLTTEPHEVALKASALKHFLRKQVGYSHQRQEAHIIASSGILRVRPAGRPGPWSKETRNLHCSLLPGERTLTCEEPDQVGDAALGLGKAEQAGKGAGKQAFLGYNGGEE
jgi:hypothetical protein